MTGCPCLTPRSLGMSVAEFQQIFEQHSKGYRDYRNKARSIIGRKESAAGAGYREASI